MEFCRGGPGSPKRRPATFWGRRRAEVRSRGALTEEGGETNDFFLRPIRNKLKEET